MSGRELSETQRRHLTDCLYNDSACTRVGRPYAGAWGEGRWGGDIKAVRRLEAESLLVFVSLHRDPVDRTLIRRSTITLAGLAAIGADYVLGMPPKGHEEITPEAWRARQWAAETAA